MSTFYFHPVLASLDRSIGDALKQRWPDADDVGTGRLFAWPCPLACFSPWSVEDVAAIVQDFAPNAEIVKI